jgi:hypothetical protein
MAYTASQRNPFMLMLNPEVVLAAIEKSERLSQLNRHLCRPLDRIPAGAPEAVDDDAGFDDAELEAPITQGQ